MRAADIRKALKAGTPLAWDEGLGKHRAVKVTVVGEDVDSTGRWYVQRAGQDRIAYSRNLLGPWDEYRAERDLQVAASERAALQRRNNRIAETAFATRVCAAIKTQTGQHWKPDHFSIVRTDTLQKNDTRLALRRGTAAADLLCELLGLTPDGVKDPAAIPQAASEAAKHVRTHAERLRRDVIAWTERPYPPHDQRRLYDSVHHLRGEILLVSDLAGDISQPRLERVTGTSWSGLWGLAQELRKDSPDIGCVLTLVDKAIPKEN